MRDNVCECFLQNICKYLFDVVVSSVKSSRGFPVGVQSMVGIDIQPVDTFHPPLRHREDRHAQGGHKAESTGCNV